MTWLQDMVSAAWADIAVGSWQHAALGLAAVASLLSALLVLAVLVRQAAISRRAAREGLARLEERLDRLERAMREESRTGREETAGAGERLADRVGRSLHDFGETHRAQMTQLFEIQRRQHTDFATRLTQLGEAQARSGEALRGKVEEQLTGLRRENEAKLEVMRATVDEKLQGTLEKRLGESFKQVSERLEAVHQGLGEMQTLASGVGDLKRVLTNVKTRGGWGEIQLGTLLDQILVPSQYAANALTGEGRERVEFAIRLPGRDEGAEVLLPIDAKFPVEDFERLQAAAEAADQTALAEAGRALEARIRQCARDISTKYINPPVTTDFAILFLPTEGLYAEVIRRTGLCDELQRAHRVTIAGPTTLTALLNSLQMGFRTLAIQQRSSEVWQVLGAVKTEFGRFGPVLEKVKKKLQEASNSIEEVGRRERAIQRRIRDVEALPSMETAALLGHAAPLDEDDADDTGDAPEAARAAR